MSYFSTEPHSAPTNIVIPSTEEQSATITWQPPLPDDRNGMITFYLLVIRNLQFAMDDIKVNVSGSDLSYTVGGLEEYCRYDCQIAAGTVVGAGPYSSRVQFVTMEDGNVLHTLTYTYTHTINSTYTIIHTHKHKEC